MRAAILPLAFTAAVLAGCGSDSPQRANQETASRGVEGAALPERDLTLQTPVAPAVEVASPVELSRVAPEPKPAQRARVAPKPAPAPAPDPVPEAAPAAQAPVPDSTVAVADVGDGRELAPGKTVTIIPASSGPSFSPEDPSWAPAGPVRSIGGGEGRGGRCRPRGGVRGIGIAGRIPSGVPGLRLR
jgi:pyruvate dehydrogenase E2 component (dihydrolipoamide acetyltransferase)